MIPTYRGDDSYIICYYLHPMLLSEPKVQFPWQSMGFLVFSSMKWINTHGIEMNWSLIKCFYLLKSVQQGQMGGVWESDTSLNKKMSYFALQEAPVEETHLPTLFHCWACHAAQRGTVSTIISLLNEHICSSKRKIKLSLLEGKKNPADNPQGGFLILCSYFHLLRLLEFLCLGNLDIKGKSE